MKIVGANLLVKTLECLANGTLIENEQDVSQGSLKHAPKLFTELCKIDFNKPANVVHNQVRGLPPFPGAFTLLNEKVLKIYRTKKNLVLFLPNILVNMKLMLKHF